MTNKKLNSINGLDHRVQNKDQLHSFKQCPPSSTTADTVVRKYKQKTLSFLSTFQVKILKERCSRALIKIILRLVVYDSGKYLHNYYISLWLY